jgi:hypothetical protein
MQMLGLSHDLSPSLSFLICKNGKNSNNIFPGCSIGHCGGWDEVRSLEELWYPQSTIGQQHSNYKIADQALNRKEEKPGPWVAPTATGLSWTIQDRAIGTRIHINAA